MSSQERYARQIQVDKIGGSGQAALKNTSVLIVGVGGLGCQVGALLAGAGIGKVTLVDHDIVAISNLHRQILFRENDVGESKALVAARELRAINGDIEVDSHNLRLDHTSLPNVIGNATIVIDAADNFLTTYILSDYCYEHRIPLISASVNSTFGWIGVFCGTKEKPMPSLRAVFPRLASEALNCETVGVTGPSVGIIASAQAQETLKIAIDDDAQLSGKMLYFDLWKYHHHIVDFSGANEPEDADLKFLSAEDINDGDLVIDVRSPQEVSDSPMAFQSLVALPLMDLPTQLDSLPRDRRLVLACASGQRAMVAGQQLLANDFTMVAVLVPNS